MNSLPPIFTDRTRYQTYLDCPRRRWWAFEWGRDLQKQIPGGITPIALSMPLATGVYVHRGIAALLKHCPPDRYTPDAWADVIDICVRVACDSYTAEVAARGLAVEDGGDAAFTALEQAALIEAFIRAYAVIELPKLLAEYEAVETEKERVTPLLYNNGPRAKWNPPPEIIWQSRADALLRQRSTGDLYVLSLKTLGGEWNRRKESENRHDVQGLSEAATIEANLAEADITRALEITDQAQQLAHQLDIQDFADIDQRFAHFQDLRRAHLEAPRRVEGILMQFLLKGERRQEGSSPFDEPTDAKGKWEQHSPLVRAYRRQKSDPVTLEICYEYAWSAYWRCAQPHVMRKSKWYPDAKCPGDGRRHKLGDDWENFYVWEQVDPFRVWTPSGVREYPPGVHGWIAALNDTRCSPDCNCTVVMVTCQQRPHQLPACEVCGKPWKSVPVIQPDAGPCLPAQFVTPPAYRRQQQDIDQWRTQAAFQETEVAERAEIVRRLEDPANRQKLLDQWFGMNRRACDWPTSCPFIPLCHESTLSASEINPLDLGTYRRRQPHHQPEAEAFAEVTA